MSKEGGQEKRSDYEGEKPQKGKELGKGCVGLDVGPSTLAASSNTQVTIDVIAENEAAYKKFDKELWKINRQMDRSRRATNPDNYTEDGQIKRGKKLKTRKKDTEKDKQVTDEEINHDETDDQKRDHMNEEKYGPLF